MTELKTHPLKNKDLWGVIPIVNYKNCLVTKTKKGYTIFGKEVSTPEEVDSVIEDGIKALEKSIKQ